jgi:DNA-binding transcriptional LysR family regulator
MNDHPDLKVELLLTQRLVKLVEDGIDIAVRIADLSDSALHAVRIADVHRVLVASPTYLAARGEPDGAAALHSHRLIMYDNFAPNGEWRFGPTGKPAIRLDPCLTTNSAEAAIDAAVLGGGITRALCYQVAAHVRADRLRYVLVDLTPPSVPVNLVFQAKRSRSPNVRAFIDAARAHFGQDIINCAAHCRDRETEHKLRKPALAKARSG